MTRLASPRLAVSMATNHSGKMEKHPMTSEPSTTVHYPEHLHLRVPRGLGAAAATAAAAEDCRPSEYLRRVILTALRADGVRLDRTAA